MNPLSHCASLVLTAAAFALGAIPVAAWAQHAPNAGAPNAIAAPANAASASSAEAPASIAADPTVAAFEGVRAIGRRWDQAAFDRTAALYTAVHRTIAWPGLLAPEIVAYGPDPAQHLVLFRPEQGFSEPGPVILFLHGNGLGERDVNVPGSDGLIYGHIGKLGATVGGIGVVASYRTGTGASRETGTEDLRRMLTWLRTNVAAIGGDPDTIVVLANSDGATMAARYLFDATAQLQSGPGIAAAILSSGIFGASASDLAPLIESYRGPRVPLALWSAEYDPTAVESGIAEVYLALCRKYEQCPWFEQIHNHNHVSQVMSLGTADSSVANALIRFYHTVR